MKRLISNTLMFSKLTDIHMAIALSPTYAVSLMDKNRHQTSLDITAFRAALLTAKTKGTYKFYIDNRGALAATFFEKKHLYGHSKKTIRPLLSPEEIQVFNEVFDIVSHKGDV